MRLYARDGYSDWMVWDCEACTQLRFVVWVDTESAQYGAYRVDQIAMGQELPIDTHQVNRIKIAFDARAVLINPIADDQDNEICSIMEIAA